MGNLYVVPTPIGNLSDMSKRAWDTLENVDFIAAEDTRVCMKLLSFSAIKKPIVSYYEHNKRERGEYILSRILAGEDCALVSDAGTPAISDPGEDLCAICAAAGVRVIPIPGCCAAITALSASGFPSQRFTFEGFLSTSKKNRREHLLSVAKETRTMIFYEAPHKLKATLDDMFENFGDREICICREVTKMHEEFIRTTLSEAIRHFEQVPPKGEFVLILKGYSAENDADSAQSSDELMQNAAKKVAELIGQGTSHTKAVKTVSAEYGVQRSELYKLTLNKQ